MDRRARRALAGLALLAGGAALMSTGAPGCLPAGKCDGSWAEYCAQAGPDCQGRLIDPYTWVSGPIDGNFLDYPRERNWWVHFRDGQTGQLIAGRFVGDFTVMLSAVKHPSDPGQTFAEASGNLAVMHPDGDTSMDVRNDTCADYFMWMIVHNVPDADAGPADAASE